MNIRLALRYAMMITLLSLLWLSLEFMVGLQDQYIAWYPYISLLAIIIPIVITYRALSTKRDLLHGQISFAQGLSFGLLIAFLTAVFSIPAQLVFHFIINPDYFQNMIQYAVTNGRFSPEQAVRYYNLNASLVQGVLYSFVLGAVIAFISAYFMRSPKRELK